jgi:colanic acid/amylovoran biosynthesis glycosyltransferase
MPNNVLHFVRKSTQLKATFIKGQITKHVKYKPFIVVKEYIDKMYDGGYAEFDFSKYKILFLNEESKSNFKYKYLRRISKTDVKKILDFIKNNEINILHFHYGTDAGIYNELMKHSGLPSVVSFYGYDSSSFPRMYLGLGKIYLQRRVFKFASKILAMSKDMKKDLLKIGCDENKIIIHYQGCNTDKYLFTDRIYQNKEKIVLFFLARFDAQKGHLFLLESIKRLINKGITNFEVWLVGAGILDNKLTEFIKKNKLEEYVKKMKPVKANSDELLNLFKEADIFVHPSVTAKNGDKEGIPGAIVEAMLTGLPVISTFHSGIPFVIKDGITGALVNEWDYDSLANKINLLINDVELREKLGRNAQNYAKDNLNLSIKEKELEEIYDSLIDLSNY